MNLFSYVFLLIVSPTVGWERIGKLNITPKLLQSKVYIPTLLVLSLSAFMQLCYDNNLTIVRAFINALILFATYLSTFHICSLAMNFYTHVDDKVTKDRMDNMLFFALEYLVILSVINNMLPSGFLILKLLVFYVFFIIMKGLNYIKYNEPWKFFVSITSALLVILPPVIYCLLEAII